MGCSQHGYSLTNTDCFCNGPNVTANGNAGILLTNCPAHADMHIKTLMLCVHTEWTHTVQQKWMDHFSAWDHPIPTQKTLSKKIFLRPLNRSYIALLRGVDAELQPSKKQKSAVFLHIQTFLIYLVAAVWSESSGAHRAQHCSVVPHKCCNSMNRTLEPGSPTQHAFWWCHRVR